MKEHKWPKEPNPGNNFCCVIRGAVKHQQMTATCFDVPGIAGRLMPEPARRIVACEDNTVGDRIAELRKEREEALNYIAPDDAAVVAAELDFSCG